MAKWIGNSFESDFRFNQSTISISIQKNVCACVYFRGGEHSNLKWYDHGRFVVVIVVKIFFSSSLFQHPWQNKIYSKWLD